MSSVTDLFAKRKKKKGKGKKSFNANKALPSDVTSAPSSATADDRSLTIKAKGIKALATGDWTDDVENKPRQHATMTLGMKLGELDSAPAALEEHEHVVVEAQQEIQTMFHQSRQQVNPSEAAPKKLSDPEAAKPAAVGGWRAREAERQLRAGGESSAALKHLDSDAIFPTLGGRSGSSKGATSAAAAAAAASVTPSSSSSSGGNPGAWGTVKAVGPKASAAPKQDVNREACFKGDFLRNHKFDGSKPGYMFTTWTQGTGYYWEGPKEAVAEEEPQEEGEEAAAAAPTPAAAAAAAPTPPAEAPRAAAAEAPAPAGTARFGGLKKKKKKKKKALVDPEGKDLVVAEPAPAEPAPAAEPAAPAQPEAPPPADKSRFAGLKKKKKKKKSADK